jgi:hypothetical protein
MHYITMLGTECQKHAVRRRLRRRQLIEVSATAASIKITKRGGARHCPMKDSQHAEQQLHNRLGLGVTQIPCLSAMQPTSGSAAHWWPSSA